MSSIKAADVARSLKWVASVKLLSQIATFLTTIIISKFLTKEEFGLSAMAFVVMGLIDSLIDFGFGAAIIQRKEVSNSEYSSCFWLLVICGVVAASFLYMAAPVFAHGFNNPQVSELLEVMALALLCAPIQIIYRGILNRRYALATLAKTDLIGFLVRSSVCIALAVNNYGVWSIALGFLAEKILIAGALPFISRWTPEFYLNLKELKPFISFGSKITAGRIIYYFLARSDVIIVGRLLGAETLGIYSIASQFSTVIFQLITSAGISVAYPLFSRLRDTEHFLKQIKNSEQLVAIISIPALAGLMLISTDLISVSLGSRWSEAAVYLRYICIATLFQVLGFLLPQALNAINKTVINIYFNIIFLAINFSALYIAAFYWEIKGLLLTSILVTAIRFGAILLISKKILGINIRETLADIAGVGLITVTAMALTFFFVNNMLMQTSPYLRITLMIATAAFSYLSLQLLFFRSKTISIYKQMVKR